MSINIKQLPEAERPYEKLELYGEKNLSNAELIAIIIKTGTKDETSVQLAQKILNMNGFFLLCLYGVVIYLYCLIKMVWILMVINMEIIFIFI